MTDRPRKLFDISPDPIRGRRDQAFLEVLDAVLASRPARSLVVQDPRTCPAAALPALIAEYSVEEFIAPGLDEGRIRDIVASAWALHEGKGFDDGVQLGMRLLGARADILHWHEMDPHGQPNTNITTVFAQEKLFGEDVLLGPRQVNAIVRMHEATKRMSQDSSLRIGISAELTTGACAAANGSTLWRRDSPIVHRAVRRAVRPIAAMPARGASVAFMAGLVQRPARRASRASVGVAARGWSAINTISTIGAAA